ncbi:nitrate reductase, transmembrane protein [Actinobacillus pleuropneumoniae]|uniref:Nitrate reductase, transmembrane protein n=1 Tax=Actinobacillus pleuropneumoniae serotype 3 (strain JL03) TaxID=434271 RepID=B0BS09_ACTPJ|nr:cytochrome c nitrite reductase subunit NrfD [Actinobacillus pleuropneumoniae]ABY68709.1 nitrate reductase, transmembrane protein [Actinobacillus pleuropneumoniae serovar 3 str. JL03]EFM90764.1 Protein nrfD [Actinobacillus pleuropneumoniae serovar 4 str. M62]UKH13694.1 cytochrome c nitrite reductase subunit NrfD [Actinobacillus pleuropneumoniae]UKH21861.1 cytochrome c nitrite reductase subunit NrfD [Actinobacillus pleuropneumoniae]UKH40336.1 cytochrome c nitrite reductase subunit NrfD [Actin
MNSYIPFQTPNLVWDSTIAIYLFLLGISSGAVQLAIAYRNSGAKIAKNSDNWVIRSAAILGTLPTLIGLTLLIFHLTKPWTFWKLMFNYNGTSVMSMGVMLFQVYMAVLVVWIAIMFKDWLAVLVNRYLPMFKFVLPWVDFAETRLLKAVEFVLFVLAAVLGAYTGFLLSALISYPMLNNPVLPALFLASGTSSGIAATFLVILLAGKLSGESNEVHFMHKFEVPIMVTELGLLVAFFVGLHFGGADKQLALQNALSGFWGTIFWVGVFFIGILIPLVANIFGSHSLKHNVKFIILVSIFDLIGVLCLRYFILYAGQLTIAS